MGPTSSLLPACHHLSQVPVCIRSVPGCNRPHRLPLHPLGKAPRSCANRGSITDRSRGRGAVFHVDFPFPASASPSKWKTAPRSKVTRRAAVSASNGKLTNGVTRTLTSFTSHLVAGATTGRTPSQGASGLPAKLLPRTGSYDWLGVAKWPCPLWSRSWRQAGGQRARRRAGRDLERRLFRPSMTFRREHGTLWGHSGGGGLAATSHGPVRSPSGSRALARLLLAPGSHSPLSTLCELRWGPGHVTACLSGPESGRP